MQRQEPSQRANQQACSDLSDLIVSLSIPKNLHVPLVNGAVLTDYETWLFVASLLANAMVGFIVAALTTKHYSLFATAIVFSMLFGIATRMTFLKRRLLRQKSKKFTLRSR